MVELADLTTLLVAPLASKNMAQIRPALNIGWRKIHITTRGSQSSKIVGCDTSGYYFAHSYTINVPEDQIFANSEFSGIKFPAIVGADNVVGTRCSGDEWTSRQKIFGYFFQSKI